METFKIGEYFWKTNFNGKNHFLGFLSYEVFLAHSIQFSKDFFDHVL